MIQKIDYITLEKVRALCYENLLFEMINQTTMHQAKYITGTYFHINNEYKVNRIKCDYENNPPNVIDSGRVLIYVWEATDNPQEEVMHTITL